MKTGASLVLITAMFRVAVSVPPLPSSTETVNELEPTSPLVGVPESVPFAATPSHAGPLTFA